MNCIKITAIVYIIGCVLSYIILRLTTLMAKRKDRLNNNIFLIGVFSSWIVVCYFVILMYKKATGKKIEKTPIFTGIYTDSEMMELTLERFWVNVIKYPNFDNPGKLPLKDSPLCKQYHHPKFQRGYRCLDCPVFQRGFSCMAKNSLFSEYIRKANVVNHARRSTKSTKTLEAERVNAAIKVAKIFESIYRELRLKGK